MTTGRVLAASPRSASQTSPGWGFIKQVENLLFGGARAGDVQKILIGEVDDFGDALPGLRGGFGLPGAQPSVQLLCQGVHGGFYLEISVT